MVVIIPIDGNDIKHGDGSVASLSLTTLNNPELVYVVVAWKDTKTAKITGLTATTLAFTSRGGVKTYGSYKMQAFTAAANANLTGEAVSVTFSVAPTGSIVMAGFAINLTNTTNTANPFDAATKPQAAPFTGKTITSTSTLLSTDYNNDLIFGALLIAPATTVTKGSVFTELFNVSATDFTFELEYLYATAKERNLTVNWTFTSGNYSGITLGDAVRSLNSTISPYKTEYKGAVVDTNVATWSQAVISTSGDTTTYDSTGGDTDTITETFSGEQNPVSTGVIENKWDGTTTTVIILPE